MFTEKNLSLALMVLILATVVATAAFLISQWPAPASPVSPDAAPATGGHCYSLILKTEVAVDAQTLVNPPGYLVACHAG